MIEALLVSLAFVAAALWPALRDPPRDSFPLSTYPMFSTHRKTSWIHVIVGFDEAGGQRRIPPTLVANLEVMQAAETIRQAIRRRRADDLCREVAVRVAEDPDFSELTRLEVQSRRFDPLTYFASEAGRIPQAIKLRAGCAVPRAGDAREGEEEA